MPSTSSMISSCLRGAPSGPASARLVAISRTMLDILPAMPSLGLASDLLRVSLALTSTTLYPSSRAMMCAVLVLPMPVAGAGGGGRHWRSAADQAPGREAPARPAPEARGAGQCKARGGEAHLAAACAPPPPPSNPAPVPCPALPCCAPPPPPPGPLLPAPAYPAARTAAPPSCRGPWASGRQWRAAPGRTGAQRPSTCEEAGRGEGAWVGVKGAAALEPSPVEAEDAAPLPSLPSLPRPTGNASDPGWLVHTRPEEAGGTAMHSNVGLWVGRSRAPAQGPPGSEGLQPAWQAVEAHLSHWRSVLTWPGLPTSSLTSLGLYLSTHS
jgi:hypothetical protein